MEIDEGALFADGYDEAIIGIVWGTFGSKDRIAYATNKVLQILQERDGMTEEEATEFFDFNIVGSYVGEQTPLFVDSSYY